MFFDQLQFICVDDNDKFMKISGIFMFKYMSF